MSLKEVLEWVGRGSMVVHEPAFPKEPRVAKAKIIVEQRLDALYAEASGLDIDDLCRRFRSAIATGQLDSLVAGEWRYAPLCLMQGDPPLIKETGFVQAYLRYLEKNLSRLALRRLIHVYLDHFDPATEGIGLVGQFLAARVDELGKEWMDRHSEAALFNPSLAPARLASKVMEEKRNPIDYLTTMGFERSLCAARLAGHAFLEALKWSRVGPATQFSLGVVRRLTDWGMKQDREFRYGSLPGARGKLADTLLLPWVSRDPAPQVQEFIEGFLLEHYKDLRINPNRWNDVSEEAKGVMRRWLTKASLDWFLNVVDETCTDYDSKRMWPARRKFWGAYYKNGFMQEAWVVFGRDGTEYARSANRREKMSLNLMSFGRLQGGRVKNNHAVLLMRVGDLTIADWNFMGKCHIWLGDNPRAPRLYGPGYDRDDLTLGADFEQVHRPNSWQLKVYDFLLGNTGASMRKSEYL